MRPILALMRREILAFFVSPVAYFVITGFLLLGGFFFFSLLGNFNLIVEQYSRMPMGGGENPNLNQWVIEGFFQTLLIIMVFLLPLLTMRIVAEEKYRGTFELLVTSPLSVTQIVVGKFLGLAAVVLIMCVLVSCFPFLLFMLGDPTPEIGPLLSGFLGILLCGFVFSSIGMAVSCFTENQVVAGITSMVTLLLLHVLQAPAQSIGGATGEVLTYLSPVVHARDMFKGVIGLKSLCYFATMIVLGIFLSQRALEAYRWR
jgi:ABC-2 type transport system permease protein